MNEPLSRDEIKELLEEALQPVTAEMRSMRRTIRGEEAEGNRGVLRRLLVVERRLSILIWTIPIWVTAGTGFGQLLINLWGIG